jgi:hypothetical protein
MARQPPGGPRIRRQPDRGECRGEVCTLGEHPKITGQGDAEAGSGRHSVDRTDHRHLAVQDRVEGGVEHIFEQGAEVRPVAGLIVGLQIV